MLSHPRVTAAGNQEKSKGMYEVWIKIFLLFEQKRGVRNMFIPREHCNNLLVWSNAFVKQSRFLECSISFFCRMRSAVDHQPPCINWALFILYHLAIENDQSREKNTILKVLLCKNGKFYFGHVWGVAARTLPVIVPSWRALSFFSQNHTDALRDSKSFSLTTSRVRGRTFHWSHALHV